MNDIAKKNQKNTQVSETITEETKNSFKDEVKLEKTKKILVESPKETIDVSKDVTKKQEDDTTSEVHEKKVTKKTKKQEKKQKKEASLEKEKIRKKIEHKKQLRKEKKKILKEKEIKIKNFKEKQIYLIEEAIAKIKANKIEKFDASLNVIFNLNLNSKKYPEHNLRGFFQLPHSLGKKIKICAISRLQNDAFTKHDLFLSGGKEVIEEISKKKKIEFDLLLATPEMMGQIGRLGKMLGPKKLMPSVKNGTLTSDLDKAIVAWKKGRQKYHCDAFGSLNFTIGKTSTDNQKIIENFKFCYQLIQRIRPQNVKGKYLKSVFISSTMSPGLKIIIK